MQNESDRAFKEWAVACEALQTGEQILLVRKGGIREEGGAFTIADSEFFLMPTYEHQNDDLLQPGWVTRLQRIHTQSHDVDKVTLSSYAVIDTILKARDDAQVNAVSNYHIWNTTYVKQRFDFNPYDPLYLLVLRIYNLSEPQTLPMQPAYVGCKSWVTLDRPLTLQDTTPALSNADFAQRRADLLSMLHREK